MVSLGFNLADKLLEFMEAAIKAIISSPLKVLEFISFIILVFINAGAKFLMELVLGFVKNVLGRFTISADMFDSSIHPELTFLTDFYHLFRTLGIAFLALIAMWQLFKSFFAYVGFEAEEPLKIGMRTMMFGALIMNAREIVVYILSSIYDNITNMIYSFGGTKSISLWGYVYEGLKRAEANIFNDSVDFASVGGSAVLLLLTVYMMFKLVLLCFKLVERYVLTIIYMLTFPLALSTGTTKATRQYLQGWVRGFVGNLAVQLSQITVFIALGRFWHTECVGGSLAGSLESATGWSTVIGAILAVSLVRALDKIEEFLRDIGLTAGINTGPVQGPIEFVQGIGWKVQGISTVLGITKLGNSASSADLNSYAAQQARRPN